MVVNEGSGRGQRAVGIRQVKVHACEMSPVCFRLFTSVGKAVNRKAEVYERG